MAIKENELKSGRLVWRNLASGLVALALLALFFILLLRNYFAWQMFLALALVVLSVVVLMVQVNLRNVSLRAKVETDKKYEAQLWAEIDQRREAEVRLKEHQDNLERVVAERTTELENAQNVLLEQAVETGRCQLAAMVLHNIG
ncbi:hypothetical protein KAI46_14465, partial [bacterium]|nr:hypothetical protein [bacterium]